MATSRKRLHDVLEALVWIDAAVEHTCGGSFGTYEFAWTPELGMLVSEVPLRIRAPHGPNAGLNIDHSIGAWGPLVGRGHLIRDKDYLRYQCGCMPKPRSRRIDRMGSLLVVEVPGGGYKIVID